MTDNFEARITASRIAMRSSTRSCGTAVAWTGWTRPCARPPYHDDALDDHAVYIGPGHGLVDWANAGHPVALESWQHNITNISVEIDGNTAHAESYYLLSAVKKDGSAWLGGGRYVDRHEKRDGRWAISARMRTSEWNLDRETLESPM